MNPLDWRGPTFLLFYAALSAVVLACTHLLLARLEGGPVPRLAHVDPYLIAYLRGGTAEAIRVAVLSLLDRGLLKASGDSVVAPEADAPARVKRPLEREILLAAESALPAHQLLDRRDVQRAADLFAPELQRQRLIPDDVTKERRYLVVALPALVMVGLGAAKIGIALSRGRSNVMFLLILMVIVTALLVKMARRRRTRIGDRLLVDLQSLFSGLRQRSAGLDAGGATNEVALLVGIFGIGALDGAVATEASALFPKAKSSGNSCGASCGASSCGGGGCGGGCGGCGG